MSDRIILMNGGRIVQESTPRDLYDRPASRFAAEFVGSANLLEAEIAAAHGNGHMTVTAGGLTLRASAATIGPNTRALVCIRPEAIVMTNVVSEDNVFAARVGRVSFLGASLNCELAVGGLTLRADMPARTRITEGDELLFRVAPECVVLVPDEAA